MNDFVEMNAEFEKWFSHKPARTTVAVRTLPKGVKVSSPSAWMLRPQDDSG